MHVRNPARLLCAFVLSLSAPLHGAEQKERIAGSTASPLYLKIKMGEEQKTPAFIHVFGRISRAPWILPHENITQKGLYPGARGGMVQKDDSTLAAGDESPWVDIAPRLSTNGVNFVELTACTDYKQLLPSSDFTVRLSSTASNEGLLKSFSRSGPGAGMHVVIDLADRQNIGNDLAMSRQARKEAEALSPSAGRRPKAFPVLTGCFVRPEVHMEEVVRNEIKALSALGFSGVSPEPIYLENGFVHPRATITYWHLRQDHCLHALDMPRVRQWLTSNVEELKQKGAIDDLLYVSLIDEPSSPGLDHITTCRHCIKKFPEFLKAEGLTPSFFGKQEWSEIRPSKDSETEPKLFYWSYLFRHQSLADFFKIGTDLFHELDPRLRTTVNFAESLTYYGNLVHRGTDWFRILGQNTLTYGWNEDWLPYSVSPQLCGYHADFLRSACKYRGQPFGYYTILQRPLDSELKAVTEIGHGAQAIFHYNYGPYYTGASDADSQKHERYPALQRVNHAIGGAEDFLVNARVPPSKVALHYSLATDIWRLKEPFSLYGRERSYLYLILRHLGYPVDVLTEDDIAEGRLKDYEFLVLLGSHLKRDVVPPLAQWVKAGGLLYVGAGTGDRDEFNQPLDLLAHFGLPHQPIKESQGPGRATLEGIGLKELETVRFGDARLPVLCASQRLDKSDRVQVRATFSDGAPALVTKPIGKGQVTACGFFPGIAYAKAAALSGKEREDRWKKEGREITTLAPPAYSENCRWLFGSLLEPITYRPPVRTSHPLVEANLLESPRGLVLALANWSGEPQKDVQISFRSDRKIGIPASVKNKLMSIKSGDGTTTFTMDIDSIAFVVFPSK